MRAISMLLLLLSFLTGKGQYKKWHAGVGVTEATINFKQNGAGALALPIRFDLFRSANSSLSLGTNLKIGSEDEYGVSFPAITIGLLALSAVSNGTDFSGLGNGVSSNTSHSAYTINAFVDLPLLIHYNWGLGSNSESQARFGWFIGGGMSYTVTGVSLNSSGYGQSASFFGWAGNIGIRFARDKELGFSLTQPIQNNVGPIHNPMLYALTFAFYPNGRNR